MFPLLHCCFIINYGINRGKSDVYHILGFFDGIILISYELSILIISQIYYYDQMKQHRIMKVVEIQNNYQRHKQRLMSIQHIDTRKKQSVSTLRPSQASISYKQSRLKAEMHSFKSRNSKIQEENLIMLGKIQRQYGKTSNKKSRVEVLSRSGSSHSVRSNRSEKSIQNENIRIYQKINNTKSIYSNIRRENSQRSGVKQNTSKEQLLNLLVNQLGVKPTVLFPVVPRIIRPHKSFNNRTMQLRQKKSDEILLRNLQSIRKKHGFINPTLPS